MFCRSGKFNLLLCVSSYSYHALAIIPHVSPPHRRAVRVTKWFILIDCITYLSQLSQKKKGGTEELLFFHLCYLYVKILHIFLAVKLRKKINKNKFSCTVINHGCGFINSIMKMWKGDGLRETRLLKFYSQRERAMAGLNQKVGWVRFSSQEKNRPHINSVDMLHSIWKRNNLVAIQIH